jgi:hypothetical protein
MSNNKITNYVCVTACSKIGEHYSFFKDIDFPSKAIVNLTKRYCCFKLSIILNKISKGVLKSKKG